MPVRTVTLNAGVVSTVTVPGDYDQVAVFHTGNVSNDVYATANDTDPVAAGNDVYLIPAGAQRVLNRPGQTGDSDVRLLSSGGVVVEVEFG